MSKRENTYVRVAIAASLLLCGVVGVCKAMSSEGVKTLSTVEFAEAGNGSYCVDAWVNPGLGNGGNFVSIPTGAINDLGEPELLSVRVSVPEGASVVELTKQGTFAEEANPSTLDCHRLPPPLEVTPPPTLNQVGICSSTVRMTKTGEVKVLEGGGTSYWWRTLDRNEFVDESC